MMGKKGSAVCCRDRENFLVIDSGEIFYHPHLWTKSPCFCLNQFCIKTGTQKDDIKEKKIAWKWYTKAKRGEGKIKHINKRDVAKQTAQKQIRKGDNS